VFLHHPADDVVAQALASPYLDGSLQLHSESVAELLIAGRVPEEAATAVWRMDDHGVTRAFLLVFNHSDIRPEHVRALDWLRRTCPPDRREFARRWIG
jgi:hypothetical protein